MPVDPTPIQDPAQPLAPQRSPVDHGRAAGALAWAAVVAGSVAAPLAFLASGRTLSWRDTASLLGPVRVLVVEALRDLRLPLWNPHEVFGYPLFAQLIHGVLHPVSLTAALLAPGAGMDALIVVYVGLAGAGAAALARALGVSRGASAVAGLAYAASGYVLGMSAVLTYLAAAATAPWAIAAMRVAAEGRRWGAVLAALAVAALHFAGDPQWTVIAVALGAVLAFESGGARGLALVVVAVVLGTALAAVQLVPAWAFLPETHRGQSLSAEDRAQWALAPWRLVELVAPGFFNGRPGQLLERPVFLWLGGPTQEAMRTPFVPSVYVGAAVLALAAFAAWRTRLARTLTVAALVLGWIALGVHAGAEQLLHAIPVWGGFRYSEKLVGPLTLVLAVLAALGADRVRSGDSRRAPALGAAGGAALALAALLGLFPSVEGLAPAGAPPGAVAEARLALSAGLVHCGLALLALAALAWWAARSPLAGTRFAALAAAVVLVEGVAAAPYALHAGDPRAVEPRPLQGIVSGSPVARLETPVDGPPYRSPIPLDAADLEAAARSRLGVAPFAIPSGIDHVNTYTGLLPRRTRALGEALGGDLWRTLRRFAVTHVALKSPRNPLEDATARDSIRRGTLVGELPEWGISVYAVPHRPWASFAERVAVAASDREALDRFVAADLAGIPEVVLQGAPLGGTAAGRVIEVERRPERVRVVAEADGDAVLVVNDAWWPGWRATLDGEAVPILRADYIVRAVAWPAGRHVLEMRYEPPEVRLGWAISAAAAAAVIAIAGVEAWRRRAGRRVDSAP